MEKPETPASPEQEEGKPEHPEKAEVELELAELDKVSGGAGGAVAGSRQIAASTQAVGVYQIVPISPDATAEDAPAVPGVSQIEAI